MNTTIRYSHGDKLNAAQFIDVLKRSGLDERRPVDDEPRIAEMLNNANLVVTAWDGDVLVGISRAITDFSYCCYLSDLAVDRAYQSKGIGKELIRLTHEHAGPQTTLILLSAPAAVNYYPKIGMEKHPACFVIKKKQ